MFSRSDQSNFAPGAIVISAGCCSKIGSTIETSGIPETGEPGFFRQEIYYSAVDRSCSSRDDCWSDFETLGAAEYFACSSGDRAASEHSAANPTPGIPRKPQFKNCTRR